MNKWDQRFLDMAQLVASWSKDPSTKVGAVIVDSNRRVVSQGYNGFPQGMDDYPSDYQNREIKLSRIIHAEMNALLFAGRRDMYDCTLYTWPFMPCDRCVVHLIQAGIRNFVAPEVTLEQYERWGVSFERTQDYIAEAGGLLIQL